MRYLFVLPPVLFVAAVHLYVWWRLVRDTGLSPRARLLATLIVIGFALLFPPTYIVWFRSHSAYPWHFALAYGWLGAVGYATAVLVAWDVGRLALWLTRRLRRRRVQPVAAPPSAAVPAVEAVPAPGVEMSRQTRRVFVARTAAGSALLVSGAASAFGVRAALWDITTPEVTVALPRLPRELEGYSIALLTDIHIGPMLDGRFLRHLVEQTNRLRPDAIAIGGDLVDGRVFEIGDHVAELGRLRARDGVYYVTGNHEYYWNAGAWMELVSQLGIRVLLNERVTLGDSHPTGAQFDFVGVPDASAGKRHPVAADVTAAVAGRDPERELVVLAHKPIQVVDSARVGAGLQLSGHTHGGQLNPFGAVAALSSQGYVAGLYRHAGAADAGFCAGGDLSGAVGAGVASAA